MILPLKEYSDKDQLDAVNTFYQYIVEQQSELESMSLEYYNLVTLTPNKTKDISEIKRKIQNISIDIAFAKVSYYKFLLDLRKINQKTTFGVI